MSYSNRTGHPQQYQQYQHYHHVQQQAQPQHHQHAQQQYEHSGRVHQHPYHHQRQHQQHQRHQPQPAQPQMQTPVKPQAPLPHNGQNNHNQRRCSKVPLRELPEAMPEFQHPVYPQLYTVQKPHDTCYKWDCIILDLDRTIIHGKRLSVNRWRKYVENGTIPSLAENQCSKWHRHIHRRGHQMHPFIRGRTMIYYRPFTWHLLAVLDYLKSHFGTKIIVCTKAGEHYAASVLAALISNFTSANPDLIDDVYNFHDLHDDPEEEGKPKKPFRLICNRHDLDPSKTLIVDDNATSWFGDDRKMTNFWMPPCYGYQIHDIDNELQLLCKYLWDPIQQNHLKKKTLSVAKPKQMEAQQTQIRGQRVVKKEIVGEEAINRKRFEEEQQLLKLKHVQQHSQNSVATTDSSTSQESPKREIISRTSPKSLSTGSSSVSPNQRYLSSPHSQLTPNSTPHGTPKTYPATNGPVQFQQSISYSTGSSQPDSVIIMSHNHQNNVELEYIDDEAHHQPMVTMKRISRGYNKRKFSLKDREQERPQLMMAQNVRTMDRSADRIVDREPRRQSGSHGQHRQATLTKRSTSRSPTGTKTKKKGYFFESKSRGSKKLAKIIGK